MKDSNQLIEAFAIRDAAALYRAINHPLRQRILKLLHKQSVMNVSDLYRKLSIEQSVASQQLGILRRARLVSVKREARFVLYSVNYQRLQQFHAAAAALNEKLDDK